jgi:cytoskeletal protein CcmA (bactofilin family)
MPESDRVQLLSIVGPSARLEGTFEVAESIQIECEVGGRLTVGGKLVIGQRGVVHADIHAAEVVVMGEYDGSLVATGGVEIAATGRVTGSIRTDSLVIAKGGFFNGSVTRLDDTTAESQGPHPVVHMGQRRAALGR